MPEVLTLEAMRTLLRKARPIWVSAVFTGCRSGERQAEDEDCRPDQGGILADGAGLERVLLLLVNELKVEQMRAEDYPLPHFSYWNAGYQVRFLRGFCDANRLPSVRFHALRACFATQLIASGVPATVAVKIAGWKDGDHAALHPYGWHRRSRRDRV